MCQIQVSAQAAGIIPDRAGAGTRSMASGLERRLFSLSSNSAMRPDLPLYFWSRWLTRSIKAAPSGLWPDSARNTLVINASDICTFVLLGSF